MTPGGPGSRRHGGHMHTSRGYRPGALARRHGDRGVLPRRLQQRLVERDADAQPLPLSGQLRGGAEGRRHLQRGQQRRRYTIKYQKLPNGADGQRQQMVRRLAAKDSGDGHPRPRRHVGARVRRGRLDPRSGPVTTRPQVDDGTLEGPLADRHLQGQALRRAVQQQHPAALVPLRPRAHAAEDVGRDDRHGRRRWPRRASPTTSRSRATSTRASPCGSTPCWRAPAAAC